MKFERYPKYKDSGVEWIGEIPEHWEAKKIKAVLQERKESNNPVKTNNILSLCMYRGVIPYSEKGAGGNKAKEDLTAYKLAYPGDIVLNSMNVIAGSVGLSKYFGAVSPVYYMLYPRNKKDVIEFFNDVFQSKGFQKSLIGLGNGILIKQSESTGKLNTIRLRIPMDKLNSVLIPYPPREEQIKIANFLDEKTAQIDKAITLKEKLIERLKERRQILINDAVTKGLDKTVKMKDSGVEWIGEIPEHWGEEKFRFCFDLTKGLTITKADLQSDGIPCVNYGEIHSKYFFEVVPERDELQSVDQNFLETSSQSLLKKGDFVFADTSEDMEGSGNFTHLHSNMNAFAGYHTIIARLKIDAYYRYIAYFFDSLAYRGQIRRLVKGVKVYSITNAILKDTLLLLPPRDEQAKIVNFLDQKTTQIDRAIELQEKQIEKLKEHKATLIDSVVTGKVRIIK